MNDYELVVLKGDHHPEPNELNRDLETYVLDSGTEDSIIKFLKTGRTVNLEGMVILYSFSFESKTTYTRTIMDDYGNVVKTSGLTPEELPIQIMKILSSSDNAIVRTIYDSITKNAPNSIEVVLLSIVEQTNKSSMKALYYGKKRRSYSQLLKKLFPFLK